MYTDVVLGQISTNDRRVVHGYCTDNKTATASEFASHTSVFVHMEILYTAGFTHPYSAAIHRTCHLL